jgi:uncharacterized glyoxalase superfamily protein PhnB
VRSRPFSRCGAQRRRWPFYEQVFGAEEIYRNTYPDGRIVSEMAVDGARFRVADEATESGNVSPQTLKARPCESTSW